jgi:hypothetical protein
MREHGAVVWGDDIRRSLPCPDSGDLAREAWATCDAMRRHGRGGALHPVDWLFTTARLLLWLHEGRLASKTEAAGWASEHARGAWRAGLAQASRLRLAPALAESAEVRRWLDGLAEPIRDASDEVAAELVTHGFQLPPA